MKLTENIENFIRVRKPHLTTGKDTDKRILGDSFAAMQEARSKWAGDRPNLWAAVLASKAARLAAALVIVLVGLWIVHRSGNDRSEAPAVSQAAESPADMLTFMSLTMAYRHGGMEAMEKQCRQAVELLGPRTKNLSVRELFEELNGNGKNSERTRL